MDKKHYLYVLAFDADPQPVVFYVGHTNNPKRRRTEHRSSAKDTANTEYKYRWCRQLESIGVPWDFIVIGSIEDDEDAEYEWILKFARDNQSKNIKFIDDLPLTNMKAGDFLGEILNRRDINTAGEIKQYRQQQANLKTINYTRTDTGITPAPISAKSQQLIDYLKASGEVSQAKTEEQRQRAEQRAQAYLKMLNDPNRQRRIQEETERLMQEDQNETKHT
jgi:hypothetical protein